MLDVPVCPCVRVCMHACMWGAFCIIWKEKEADWNSMCVANVEIGFGVSFQQLS